MKTTFHYKKQEQYTQEELADLLAQAEVAILKTAREGFVNASEVEDLKTQLQTRNEELSSYKTKERDITKERIGKAILGDNYDKGSKYIKFEEDFDFTNEEAITAKFEELKNDFFSTTNDDAFEAAEREVGKEVKVEETLSDEFDVVFDDQK